MHGSCSWYLSAHDIPKQKPQSLNYNPGGVARLLDVGVRGLGGPADEVSPVLVLPGQRFVSHQLHSRRGRLVLHRSIYRSRSCALGSVLRQEPLCTHSNLSVQTITYIANINPETMQQIKIDILFGKCK